jgi:non-heme Fe2+,alpha-ketoglutarate-dependent halogenase
MPSAPASLSPSQLEAYRRDGFVGPITLCSPAEMAAVVTRVEEVLRTPGLAPAPAAAAESGRLGELLQRDGVSPVPYIESRHLDSPVIHQLCTHPVVVGCLRAVCGPDVILWRSTLIEKGEGSPEFRWHQDFGGVFGRGTEYGLEPPLHVSVWLALTAATVDNGCLIFVPGVRAVLPGVPASPKPNATLLVPPELVDESRALPMELAPGQFVLFSDRALHSSGANRSGRRRLALGMRFTASFVAVRPHFPGHRVLLVSGSDHGGVNALAPPPAAARGRN